MSRQHIAAVSLALLLAACGGGNGGSQSVAPGSKSDQRLNNYTASDQQRPVVAGNGRDRAVVVWESLGQDGSHLGIYGRRVQAGQPVGAEFRANSYTTGRQSFPAVGMDAAGNYLVAWRSSLQTSPGGNIFGQRYAADGTPQAGEFQIGPDGSDLDSQSEPQVALNERGDAVVAWSNRELNELATQLGRNDLETRFIQFRTYRPDGSSRSGVITATDNADDGSPRAPRVGLDAEGRLVLVWVNGTQIRARHFDADGVALSDAYNVNTVSADIAADLASVAVHPDGAFAIAWEAFTYGNLPLGISLQRYSGPQAPLAPAAVVTSPAQGLLERCSLSAGTDGGYLLAAQAQDQTSLAVIAADGGLRSLGRFSNPAFASLFPSVARSGSARATVAWQSLGQDGDGRGVYTGELSLP
ncbi:MAG: hypothetical protein Q8Q73_11690 [Stagnimonas sp.]|nr:hypothetical protein [Stagnimonas sp.]